MGMGALSPEHGDRSPCMILSPWEHGDGSAGMRVWDISMWAITWEWEFFSGILFSNNFEFF